MTNGVDESLSSAIHDAALIVAARMRPQLLELVNAGRALKKELADTKIEHQKNIEYYLNQLSGVKEENRTLLAERAAEFLARPPEHIHDPDDPQPVITVDLDGTLKPQVKRGDGGNYPLTDDFAIPFPKVKKWLDRWTARKACIHCASAGLYFGKEDTEVFMARQVMLQSWKAEWGLPLQIFLPKVGSDIYYDDRMTLVPGDPALDENEGKRFIPDWDLVGMQVEKDLNKRFDLINGVYVRKEKKRVGVEIEEWPTLTEWPRDSPRGYSGPRLDVDMHRTLSLASSSLRLAPPRLNARDVLSEYYQLGITVYISCAGWNPKTHSLIEWQNRLAGIRMWLQQNSIPYDRIVSKDHADSYIDDKGFPFMDWVGDRPAILKRLPHTDAYRYAA
jgi:hypothetical protein